MSGSNTPYRELMESTNGPHKNYEKENYESFKQKRFMEIDQQKQQRQSHDHKRKSILKATTLNLRNLAPVEQGPPTFDSEYQFRNLIISDDPSRLSKQQNQLQMQYNLRLQSLTKQYETKIKTQAQRYEFEIKKLSQIVQTYKQHQQQSQKQDEKQEYCHLCSNGEVVNSLNKMLKNLQNSHKHCISHENQSSKKIINLEKRVQDLNDDLRLALSENASLKSRIATIQAQNRVLKEKNETERIRSQANLNNIPNYAPEQVNLRHANIGPYQRTNSNFARNRPSSSSLFDQGGSTKRSSIPFCIDDLKPKKSLMMDPYQSELNAAKIIDRVKSNSMRGYNSRTKVIEERKFNYQ